MYNSSKALNDFFKDEVRLSEKDKELLRNRADANFTRLKKGLLKNGDPLPIERIKQGSYAMHTLVYQPKTSSDDKRYDLDQGVVFRKEDLVGARGAEMSPLDVRKMVCRALQDDSFKTPPEVKENCVRVYYDDGIQIDIPCYRRFEDEDGNTVYELAGAEWKQSDPRGVTEWYNNAVSKKSPDTTNGQQMRRVTRLIKKFCKSRKSWNMPSGLIISKLVDEEYAQYACEDRDDLAFLDTLQAISDRLRWDKTVKHPVVKGEYISKGKEAAINQFKDKIDEFLPKLRDVLDDPECTDDDAMKAWDDFFNTDYFTAEVLPKIKPASETLTAAVRKVGGGRFA